MKNHLFLCSLILPMFGASLTRAAEPINVEGALASWAFEPRSVVHVAVTSPEGKPETVIIMTNAVDGCELIKRSTQPKNSTLIFLLLSDNQPGRHVVDPFHVARGDAGFATGGFAKFDDTCTDTNPEPETGVMVGGTVQVDKTGDVWHGSFDINLGYQGAPWSRLVGGFDAVHCDAVLNDSMNAACE